MHTTLNALRAHSPGRKGWKKLLRYLGKTAADHEPLSLIAILESNGLWCSLWCLRALGPEWDRPIRELACDFAATALRYTTDPRPAATIEVARRFIRGEATAQELAAAKAASWAAVMNAHVASPSFAAEAAVAAANAAPEAAARSAAVAAANSARFVTWIADETAFAAARAEHERIFRAWIDRHAIPALHVSPS